MDSQKSRQNTYSSPPTNPWMVSTLVLFGIMVGIAGTTAWSSYKGNFVDKTPGAQKSVSNNGQNTQPPVNQKLATEFFQDYAGTLNLDVAAFASCLNSGKYLDEIQKDTQEGGEAGVTGTPGFLINGRYVKGAQAYEKFVSIFDEELNGTASKDVIRVTAKVDDDAVLGDINAPITMIEWSDYQCPYCARFFNQTLPKIEENYIKTGKVKLIYRDFPLDIHKFAEKAAEAAECAGDQGKYFEYHNALFERMSEWTNAS
ncbi:thioredoxin domain-containing protein [Candidatus Peregrinibacteria bacterium]|nr:thioredoxin domain-containing protein [Candidatus Peregrinibacteria bacterium]